MLKDRLRLLRQRSEWSVPSAPLVPLFPTAVLLVVVQLAGVWAWRDARAINERWISAKSTYNYESPTHEPIDDRLHQFSDEIATHSCEIGRPTPCEDLEDATSPALAGVNVEELPPISRELLQKHGYSSADHFLEALLLNGQEAVLPQTIYALVRTGKLSPFAIHKFLHEWLLAPAIEYYRVGRVEDSAVLFLQFVDAEIAALNGGTRFAGVGGVDITDLPVLFEAFCREPRSETHDLKRCAMPFLNALATATSSLDYWAPVSDEVPDFLRHYEASPSRNHGVVSYLQTEQRIGQLEGSAERWDPSTLPVRARYLGHYVKGRHLLATARAIPLECEGRTQAALLEFQRAMELAEESHFFRRAILERIEEIRMQPPCQSLP